MILKKLKPIKQKIMMCGPTCLEMVFKYYGKEYSQKQLRKLSNASFIRGTDYKQMIKAAKTLGFKAKLKSDSSIDEIRNLISNKIPPIIGWMTPKGEDHFSVICGIDKKFIHIADPKLNKIKKIEINEFEKRWLAVYCDNISSLRMFILTPWLIFKTKLNKENSYKLDLKEEEIIRKGIIIIEPKQK